MRHRGPVMKRHPLTGEPIEPVGIINGKVIYPIMGGAPDPDEDEDDDDGSDSGADDKKQTEDDDTDSGGDDDKVSRADLEALEKRMKAADKRADEAERKLRAEEDKKKDELTRAQDRVTELETEVETLQSKIKTMGLQNAFLSANKHDWHDSDVALDLADRKGYLEDVVDDDGVVNKVALGKAMDRLAKEHTYLVKPASKKDDDDDEEPPSGEPAGGRSDNSKDAKRKKQELARRFPILNR